MCWTSHTHPKWREKSGQKYLPRTSLSRDPFHITSYHIYSYRIKLSFWGLDLSESPRYHGHHHHAHNAFVQFVASPSVGILVYDSDLVALGGALTTYKAKKKKMTHAVNEGFWVVRVSTFSNSKRFRFLLLLVSRFFTRLRWQWSLDKARLWTTQTRIWRFLVMYSTTCDGRREKKKGNELDRLCLCRFYLQCAEPAHCP